LSIPAEITRRQERKAALEKARAQIEVRAQARYALERAEQRQENGRARRQERTRWAGGRQTAPSPDCADWRK